MSRGSSADLDAKEEKHVRTALRFLRRQLGTRGTLAKALGISPKGVGKLLDCERGVSASMAFRVARLAGVGIDDLLAGRYVPAGTCPHCGRAPDFADEDTAVEDGPRAAPGSGLKLVK